MNHKKIALAWSFVLSISAFALICALSAWAQSPRRPDPSNLLTNPGLETGDFTGWTVDGNTINYGVNTAGFLITGTDDSFGPTTVVVHSGTYAGYSLVNYYYYLELSQTVALDPGIYSAGVWVGDGSDSGYGDSVVITVDGIPIDLTSHPVINPGYQFVGGTFVASGLNPVVLFHIQGSGWGAAGFSFDDLTLIKVGVDRNKIAYPGDTFTQTLGINNALLVAGYHGSGASGHPNQGFVLTLPNTFSDENFPGSAQTQVIGINNPGDTAGFYVDQDGITHGFLDIHGTFSTIDFPGATFNQLLGLNDADEAAGYWQDTNGAQFPYTYQNGMFTTLDSSLPANSSAQATGVNNSGEVSGFYVDLNGVTHGFLLSGATLTTLDYPDSTLTQALGLNNAGQLVGSYLDGAGASHGFMYSVGGQRYQSYDDPLGVGTSVLNGINDLGVMVGFFTDASGNTYGFQTVTPTAVQTAGLR